MLWFPDFANMLVQAQPGKLRGIGGVGGIKASHAGGVQYEATESADQLSPGDPVLPGRTVKEFVQVMSAVTDTGRGGSLFIGPCIGVHYVRPLAPGRSRYGVQRSVVWVAELTPPGRI